MRKIKIFILVMISGVLIGCNNVQRSHNNDVVEKKKDISIEILQEQTRIQEKNPTKEENIIQKEIPEPKPNIRNQKNSIGETKAKEIALSKVPNGVIS